MMMRKCRRQPIHVTLYSMQEKAKKLLMQFLA